LLQAAEVASQIHQRRDLGTKATAQLITIDEQKHKHVTVRSRDVLTFWNTLGASDVQSAKGCSSTAVAVSCKSVCLSCRQYVHCIFSSWPSDLTEFVNSCIKADNAGKLMIKKQNSKKETEIER